MTILQLNVEYEGEHLDVLRASEAIMRALNGTQFRALTARTDVSLRITSVSDGPPEPTERDKFLNTPLRDLDPGLPTRVTTALRRVGIERPLDLRGKTDSELAAIPDLGMKGVADIRQFLQGHDL